MTKNQNKKYLIKKNCIKCMSISSFPIISPHISHIIICLIRITWFLLLPVWYKQCTREVRFLIFIQFIHLSFISFIMHKIVINNMQIFLLLFFSSSSSTLYMIWLSLLLLVAVWWPSIIGAVGRMYRAYHHKKKT